jgi:hypothetical protein
VKRAVTKIGRTNGSSAAARERSFLHSKVFGRTALTVLRRTALKTESKDQWPVLSIAALGTGGALVASVITGTALGLALILFAAVFVPLLAFRLSQLPGPLRRRLKRRAQQGVLIGLLATGAYDFARLLLVEAAHLPVNPFGAFQWFGWSIAGGHISRDAAIVIGTIYHVMNGTMFSVAYALLLAGKPWGWGIVWALGLEAAMLLLYPRMLDLQDIMLEFTVVSVTGHVAYGTVLGTLSRRWIRT